MGLPGHSERTSGESLDERRMTARLTIARRLTLLVAVLAIAVVAVASIGALGVGRIDSATQDFYNGPFASARLTDEVELTLQQAEISTLEYVFVRNAAKREQLEAKLSGGLIPETEAAIDAATSALGSGADDAQARQLLDGLRAKWAIYIKRFGPAELQESVGARSERAARAIRRIFDVLVGRAATLADGEEIKAEAARSNSGQVANETRTALIVAALIAGLIGVGISILLTRSIVRRTRRYSRFAELIAAGDYRGRVDLSGNDELTELGRLLNRMVEHREAEQTQGSQRSEFTEAMQLTGSEHEAHDLLKRHLQRSIPGSDVTVLSRNNSANRLEPTTGLEEGDPLREGLRDARPSDCLAVRSGQPHYREGEQPLMSCEICGEATTSACRPLLVGGEVIGAVLARSDRPLSESESETMRGSVVQAAPLLANLRNLSLAEHRAGTDALTGMPNQRASHETLKRAVAQAERSGQPLSVLLLDLDHFKQVNDVYGHPSGDDVLAATGVALLSTIREGDFCGRFGGEEFLALLPDTDLDGATIVGEKLRAAVEAVRVPAIPRAITISIGLAGVPTHAVEADRVLRMADRALYAAKSNGRNRVELAPLDGPPEDLAASSSSLTSG